MTYHTKQPYKRHQYRGRKRQRNRNRRTLRIGMERMRQLLLRPIPHLPTQLRNLCLLHHTQRRRIHHRRDLPDRVHGPGGVAEGADNEGEVEGRCGEKVRGDILEAQADTPAAGAGFHGERVECFEVGLRVGEEEEGLVWAAGGGAGLEDEGEFEDLLAAEGKG